MSELDEAWSFALAEAERRARLAGRHDVAEYLALRNSNDLLRTTGIDWLLTTFSNLAGQINREGFGVQTSSEEGHRFRVGASTMVGRLLTLRHGVRTLFVEAGWPRTPRDGFVKGGGLAAANIRHLGLASASQHLLLIKSKNGSPRWVVLPSHGQRNEIHETHVRQHLDVLVDKE